MHSPFHMISARGSVQVVVHVHMVGSWYDGVIDGGWHARIEMVRACLGKYKVSQWWKCKLNVINLFGVVQDIMKAFGVFRREGFPCSGNGFEVGRTGSITKGLSGENV